MSEVRVLSRGVARGRGVFAERDPARLRAEHTIVGSDGDPERYERSAVRWPGRFGLEAQGATIHASRAAAEVLDALPLKCPPRWSGFGGCARPTASRHA